MASTLVFYVNGKKIEDGEVDPDFTLLRYLRNKLRLPGTKYGCGEGGCGACTVMISRIDRKTGAIKHFSANACLAPIGAMHGLAVTTTEGIGSTETRLHPVQERLAKAHGSQCGFCTPGFVMSMYTLLRNNPKPTMEDVEEGLVGNLCRCTGYRPILEGFRSFTVDGTANGCGKSDCCQLKNNTNGESSLNDLEQTSVTFDPSLFAPYDPSQEVIFPPELKLTPELDNQSLVFRGPRSTFYRPVTMKELLTLKTKYPKAKLVIGNTEVGVEQAIKNQHYPVIIHPTGILELLQIEVKESYIEIGAAISLTDVDVALKNIIKKLSEYKTKVLQSIVEMLRWFSSCQIRNVAAIGGNIMTASPISDLNPIFMASGTSVTLKCLENEREVKLDETFFTSYRKIIAKPNEVLTSIKIPFTSENEYFMAFKQSKRKDDDIAIVNAAMKVSFEPRTLKVKSTKLSFGGMAPMIKMANKTMQKLVGQTWDRHLLETATSSLLHEMNLDTSAPGGMVQYRNALTASFFFKFYLTVRQHIHEKHPELTSTLQTDEKEVTQTNEAAPLRSTQFFQNVPAGQEKIDLIGRPIPHLSSLKQTSGEACYIDDIPPFTNELHAAIVISTRAYAKILGIDPSEALKMKGVVGFFSAKDVPGNNKYGVIVEDEEIFASDEVKCYGQMIAVIVANDKITARKAAELVKVSYQDKPNKILTINEAIQANSLIGSDITEDGNIEEGFKMSDFILEGEMSVGGQEHFYMETNVHLAIPHEGREIEMICSTQSVSDIQKHVANVLGVQRHLVTSKIKRIGGGFGGKESRSTILAAGIAVAADKLKRPVRLVLDRHKDMLNTGGRNPFLGKWKVGFNKEGNILALDLQLYLNAGYSTDLSLLVIERGVLTAENAYKIENIRITGRCCITNLPSNTAFRGFGSVQACLIMEDIMSKISEHLQRQPNTVREKNFYHPGDVTNYGQTLTDCTLEKCWNEIKKSGNYESRENLVNIFNSKNVLKKRGISLIPIKFPVAFTNDYLNQGGVLVLVYRDGSVLISHGGIEMGQGIHTKMIQVASRALQIPIETIYIGETSSDKVPNATASAGSSTADLNGMAILDACDKLLRRLEPFKKKNPEGKWKDWVTAAYFDRISLSATGFYKTPHLKDYCIVKKKGTPFSYYSWGACISEVEIDCLTGDHTLLRTDIVMDVGNSLNPAIDIGQIEGAFMQGYGLYVLEQLFYSPSGELLTRGPGAYKIPSIKDIPREFNVSLLRGSTNPRAIFSSKAIGEPPFFAGGSVFFAIRNAVIAARGDKSGPFKFDSPATAERIRMACKDYITEQISPEKASSGGWALNEI